MGALAASSLVAVSAGGATATIATVAGTGSGGYSGDGGAATSSKLDGPRDAAPTADGGFLIADAKNHRIRKVAPDGRISTVAGSDESGLSGDGGPATEAELDEPSAVAPTRDGGFVIADTKNSVIRKVDARGTISTVAGNGSEGYAGDGGSAKTAKLKEPYGVAPLPDGGLLIADHGNHRIRRVDGAGTISTVAGTGSDGFNRDGIAATTAKINEPHDVAPLADGGYLIADSHNHRVRRVTPGGLISTVAGTGSSGYSGDGASAVAAALDEPNGIAPTAAGGLLISDHKNARVRYVSPEGVISTVAGSGSPGYGGDGSSSTAAALDLPEHLGLTADGDVLIADSANHRIRRHDGAFVPLDIFSSPAPAANEGSRPAPGPSPPPANRGSGVAKSKRSQALDPPDPPQVGRDLNATAERGTVLVKLPGSSRFVELGGAASLPMGALIDATRGAVKLTSARDRRGRTQRAVFHAGAFKISQTRGRRPVTDLLMRGGDFSACKPGRTGSGRVRRSDNTASLARSRVRRELWGRGHGRFRTRGRRGAATVRGTIWLTEDRCEGTLVAVRRGRVAVRDFAARRTVLVRAGHRYLAGAARTTSRR